MKFFLVGALLLQSSLSFAGLFGHRSSERHRSFPSSSRTSNPQVLDQGEVALINAGDQTDPAAEAKRRELKEALQNGTAILPPVQEPQKEVVVIQPETSRQPIVFGYDAAESLRSRNLFLQSESEDRKFSEVLFPQETFSFQAPAGDTSSESSVFLKTLPADTDRAPASSSPAAQEAEGSNFDLRRSLNRAIEQ